MIHKLKCALPILYNAHEKYTTNDVAYVAKNMAIVSQSSIRVQTEVVVVTNVQVPCVLRGLLIEVNQLKDWQCVVYASKEDEPNKHFRSQSQEIREVVRVLIKSHISHCDSLSEISQI